MARLIWLESNASLQRCGALALVMLGLTCALPAQALPVFARQTQMACLTCHTVYPELTHFGRMFKLNGYQLDNLKDITMTTDEGQLTLSMPPIPGLAVFVMSSYTHIDKPLPDSQIPGVTSQASGWAIPQQLSLLYGGKIAPHFGAFAQITYDDASGTFNIDNTDFRFADNYILPNKDKLTYGLSLNNNPTIQDVWNTTPAFGWSPQATFVATETFVPSLAAPQIEAATAYNVIGLSPYLMWNDMLYGEVGVYKPAQIGTANPITGEPAPLDSTASQVSAGNNIYWRTWYEYDIDRYALEIGMYGEKFKFYPGSGQNLGGLTNDYNDVAEDFTIQFNGEKNSVTLKGTHVHESQSLNAFYAQGASNLSDDLNFTEFDLTYYYMRKYGIAIGYENTNGSIDKTMYGTTPTTVACTTGSINCVGGVRPVGVTNSINGSPATTNEIFELNYLPWLNVKLTADYIHYTRFNGNSTNYDGLGRNASDNDTLYVMMWFAF
jgi:hypothetical protein